MSRSARWTILRRTSSGDAWPPIAWALYGRASDFPEFVDPDSLLDRDWVSLGHNLETLKAVKFVQTHASPERIAYKISTVLGLAEAAEGGLGIGHLLCFIGDAGPGLVRLAAPEQEFASDLWLLTHPDPAPFGTRSRVPRLPRGGDRKAAQVHRRHGVQQRKPHDRARRRRATNTEDCAIQPFSYEPLPVPFIFGTGTITQIKAEAQRLGIWGTLILSTPGRGEVLANRIAGLLGERAARVLPAAVMQTPVHVTEARRSLRA